MKLLRAANILLMLIIVGCGLIIALGAFLRARLSPKISNLTISPVDVIQGTSARVCAEVTLGGRPSLVSRVRFSWSNGPKDIVAIKDDSGRPVTVCAFVTLNELDRPPCRSR